MQAEDAKVVDEMHVSYPLFVHRFGQYEIYAEIVIREKQKTVGTQAMLYVCLPVTALKFAKEPIGRVLAARECGEWHIGKEEAGLALELFRVFGMLSPKHRHDVLAILKMLFPILPLPPIPPIQPLEPIPPSAPIQPISSTIN